jgi:hypothetical protein
MYAKQSDVWFTNVTFQGDGDGKGECWYCAFLVLEGSVYAEGMSPVS